MFVQKNIYIYIFCASYFRRFLYPIQSYPRDNARTCGEFFRHRSRNRQIKHARCFFNELKFVSRDSDLFRRLLSIEFSFLFFFFFPPPFSFSLSRSLLFSSARTTAPVGLSKRLLPRERKLDNSDFLFDVKRATLPGREISCLISYQRFR